MAEIDFPIRNLPQGEGAKADEKALDIRSIDTDFDFFKYLYSPSGK